MSLMMCAALKGMANRYPPNKTEALAYLDAGGPTPERQARVIVVRSGEAVPDVMEYRVGPDALKAAMKGYPIGGGSTPAETHT